MSWTSSVGEGATMILSTLLRATTAAQVAVLLAQALLAGLALSGSAVALAAHMMVGGASLLIAVLQAGAAVLAWRSTKASAGRATASIGFLALVVLQMAAGRLQALVVHLPLGLAMFAASAWLAIQAWRPLPAPAPRSPRAGAAGPSLSLKENT
jgi:hypothetical protein